MWSIFINSYDFSMDNYDCRDPCLSKPPLLAFCTKSLSCVLCPRIIRCKRLTGYQFNICTHVPTIGLTQKVNLNDIDDNNVNHLIKSCPLLHEVTLCPYSLHEERSDYDDDDNMIEKKKEFNIQTLLRLPFLQSVTFRLKNITSIVLDQISQFTRLKEFCLVRLDFDALDLSDDELGRAVSAMSLLQKLKLDLPSGNKMIGTFLNHVNPKLKSLSLSSFSNFNNKSFELLCNRFYILEELSLLRAPIDDAVFMNLGHLPYLKILELFQSNIDDGLEGISEMRFLQKLDLRMCGNITQKSIIYLHNLFSLRELHIWLNFPINNNIIEHLQGLSQLQELYLLGNTAGPATRNTGNVGNTGSTDIGNFDMKYFSKMTSLQKLSVMGNSTNFTGFQHLKNLSNLHYFQLQHCNSILNSGLIQIGEITSLRTLILITMPNINDRGLEGLESLNELRILELFDCQNITNCGIERLSKLPNLQSLSCGACEKITKDVNLDNFRNLQKFRNDHGTYYRTK